MTSSVISRPRVRALAWGAAVLVALVAVVAFQREMLAAAIDQLRGAHWGLAAAVLGILAGVELIKAYRWQVLYGAARPPYLITLQGLLLAQLTNTVMPLRVGEGIRVVWAASSAGELARGTASLGITKLLDALVLAAIVAVMFGAWILDAPSVLVASLAALAVLTAVALVFGPRWARGREDLIARAIRWVRGYLGELHLGILAPAVGSTLLVWGLGALANAVTLAALGIPVTLDLTGRMLASGYLVGLVPAPPGRVAVYEAAVMSALVSGGLGVEAALAAALLLHGLQLAKVFTLALLATRF